VWRVTFYTLYRVIHPTMGVHHGKHHGNIIIPTIVIPTIITISMKPSVFVLKKRNTCI